MALKKIENLNIHENPATNTDQFDVENYLNANWRKIIDVVDNNANESTKLKQENEYLSKNQLYDTVKGNNVTIEGVAEGNRNSIDVFGYCEQESYSGKNLYNYDSIYNNQAQSSINVVDDELIVTRVAAGVGMYVGYNISGLEIGERYTIRSNTEIYLYKDRVYGEVYTNSSDASNGFTFIAQQGNYVIALIIGSQEIPNVGDQLNCGKIQLEKWPVATDWEPFVGEQASPNPDYPQEIKRLKGKNKFNKETVTNGYYLNESGNLVANANYCVSDFIPIFPEEKYYLPTRGSSRTKFYDSSKTAITNTWDVTDGDMTFVAPSDARYIRFTIATAGSTAVNVDTFQFNEGSTATEYEPYNTLVFKRIGKNILNSRFTSNSSNGITCERQSDGSYVLNGTSTAPVAFQTANSNYLLKAGEYTLGCGSLIPAGVTYALLYGTNNTLAQIRLSNKSTTFTVDSDTNFSDFRDYLWIASGVTLNNFVIKPILVEGTEVGDYEPYQEQTYQLTLSEGQELCAMKTTDSSLANYVDENGQKWIADYLAEDGIHKKVGVDVFSGSEDWTKHSNTYDDFTRFQLNKNEVKIWGKSICSHFIDSNGTPGKNVCTIAQTIRSILLCIDNNIATTVDMLKTWLSNNNVTFIYELEEEIVIPYTEEQAEQYAALHKVYMGEGVNNIYCTNELAKNMQVTYTQSLQYVIDEIRNAIVAEGSESNV